MSLIPIASLANGTLFDTQPFAPGSPLLIPAVGVDCQIFVHDTSTPATVKVDEFSGADAPSTLVTDATGACPGWIDPSDLPLDLTVSLTSGPKVFVLGPAPSAGLSATTADGLYTHQDGTGLPAKALAVLSGTAPAVDPSTFTQGAWLKYVSGQFVARPGPYLDPRDGIPGVSNTACACDATELTDAVIANDGIYKTLTSPTVSAGNAPLFVVGQRVNLDGMGCPATTVSGAGQTLPTGTLTVISTAGFPNTGTLTVAGVTGTVTYTGITATTFTGCTGGTGAATNGGVVASSSFGGTNLGTTVASVSTDQKTATLTDACTQATVSYTGLLAAPLSRGVGTVTISLQAAVGGSGLPSGTVVNLNWGAENQFFKLASAALSTDTQLTLVLRTANFAYPIGASVSASARVWYGTNDTTNFQNLLTGLQSSSVKRVELQGHMLVDGVQAPPVGHLTAKPGVSLRQSYGQNKSLIGTPSFTILATDLTIDGVAMFGDDAGAGSQTGNVAVLIWPTPWGSRVRIRNCYFQGFAQAGPYVKNCDLVDVSNNWVINCAWWQGGDNAINLYATGRFNPTTPSLQVFNWECNNNIVLSLNGAGACIDLECVYGDAPGGLGRLVCTGNICYGTQIFNGIEVETNGGNRNVVIANNIVLECNGGVGWGDSSAGILQNSYSDLQNFLVANNIVVCRGQVNATGIQGYSSNTSILGNVVIAPRPLVLLAPNPGSPVSSVRATNVIVKGNQFIQSSNAVVSQPFLATSTSGSLVLNNVPLFTNITVGSTVVGPGISGSLTIASFSSSLNTITLTGSGSVGVGAGTGKFIAGSIVGGVKNMTVGTRMDGLKMRDNIFATDTEVDWINTGGATGGYITVKVENEVPNGTTGYVNYGTTGHIAWNAAGTAVQTAIQAILPTAVNDCIIVAMRYDNETVGGGPVYGTLQTSVAEVQFVKTFAGRGFVITVDYSNLTGTTSTPGTTRIITASASNNSDAIVLNDCCDPEVEGNTIRGANRAAMNLTDFQDGFVRNNKIYESNSSVQTSTAGAAIQLSGKMGLVGTYVDGNHIYDRRVNSAGASLPLMTYGIDVTGVTSGRVYNNENVNRVPFCVTAKTNGTMFSYRPSRRQGMPGITAPGVDGWAPVSLALTANRGYASLFVPDEDWLATGLTYFIVTVDANNDNADAGIYDGNFNLLGSNGGTAGKVNAKGTGGAPQEIDFASAIQLRAGQPYYAAFALGTASAPPTLLVASFGVAGAQQRNQSSAGGSFSGYLTGAQMNSGAYPLPSTFTTSVADFRTFAGVVLGTPN